MADKSEKASGTSGQQEFSLEDSLKRIEDIINALEGSGISLEDSLKLYKEGVELTSLCKEAITGVEKEIEILEAKDA